ncbi:lipase [Knoellia sinensis KCTC 19936]|uniref:Lipase n=1 Tax=Knoellia sinensis KCTC 19936 TaxID=1385520 RepID=A0A0A0JA36_9MICO|nr:alpha/beta fold hydrolase [Knoellia sinensis]KGN32902.1 lipase [Knoellia sinensis KCTC 19936]
MEASLQTHPSGGGSGALSRIRRTMTASRNVARNVGTLLTPRAFIGMVIEGAWLSTHVATYPLGIFQDRAEGIHGYRIEHLAPVQRGLLISHLEAAGTPILLVHGLIDNRSIFTLLRRGLTRRGFGSIYAMNYSPFTADIRTAAAQLGEEIEAIVRETGYEKIHIVGHSLGGLIARYYVTRLGGDAHVHTLVTLGTPHHGTYAAYAAPTRLIGQMRPGSGLLRELDEPAPGCTTRFVCYWSDTDFVILPQGSGALRHPDLSVRNIRLHGVGHISLAVVGDVVHGISTTLAELDTEGGTLTAGVTPIAPRRGSASATGGHGRRESGGRHTVRARK